MKKTVVSALAGLLAGLAVAGEAPAKPLRISILGDSYSTYEGSVPKANAVWYPAPPKARNGVDSPDRTWWGIAIRALGGKLEKNNSYSGATVCFTAYSGQDRSGSSFISRVYDLGHPDMILVCGATNDSWAHSPIGAYQWEKWTNEDLYSFRPAMAKLCAELTTLYPQAKIAFLLNDVLSAEVNDSVHAICAHYGILCVDLKGIAKQENHPDAAGMRTIADQTVAAVKARFGL